MATTRLTNAIRDIIVRAVLDDVFTTRTASLKKEFNMIASLGGVE